MKLLKVLPHIGQGDVWLMECGVHGNEFLVPEAKRKDGTVHCRYCEEWMSVEELVRGHEKENNKFVETL